MVARRKHVAVTAATCTSSAGSMKDCNKKLADGREEGKLKVHVADELLYRHWTGWRDGRRGRTSSCSTRRAGRS
jgi:hypothetical protein